VNDLIDTTEMYLRTIYELEEEGVVPLRARIVERLGQSGPTVSQTVSRMERDGLLVVSGDRHLELTEAGRARAIAVMRKHRLAERLLVDVIGLGGRARRGLPVGARDERSRGTAAGRAARSPHHLAVRQPHPRP
jgi:Mn-dependent DtxR family transcriptional regulator